MVILKSRSCHNGNLIYIYLQGFAECRSFGSLGQQEGVVAITARRSRLHPGTRYLARGLNACSSTGKITI